MRVFMLSWRIFIRDGARRSSRKSVRELMGRTGFVMATRCANVGLMIADRRSFTYRVASSTRQSNGLLIRRFGVRFPGDPPAFRAFMGESVPYENACPHHFGRGRSHYCREGPAEGSLWDLPQEITLLFPLLARSIPFVFSAWSVTVSSVLHVCLLTFSTRMNGMTKMKLHPMIQ